VPVRLLTRELEVEAAALLTLPSTPVTELRLPMDPEITPARFEIGDVIAPIRSLNSPASSVAS
jgi:hypothetical protein